MPWLSAERAALVETLRDADPDGPTLCEGWTTRHVVAHLLQRDQHPLRSVVDLASRRPPGQERFLGRLVAEAAGPEGYQALVNRFARGPQRWSPMSWAGESLSLLEFVIHHEDVRRGAELPATPPAPGAPAVPARVLPDAELEAFWRPLQGMGRLGLHQAPVGVTLVLPDGRRAAVKRDVPEATVTGEPVELALYVSGRRSAARVELGGDPTAVARLEAWESSGT